MDAARYANALSAAEELASCYRIADDEVGLVETFAEPYECPGYRLPTEAEWERAARGDHRATYGGELATIGCGADASAPGPGLRNSRDASQTVGELTPNAYGLYDILGTSWSGPGIMPAPCPAAVLDPIGPATGVSRVVRGGSWKTSARFARAAYRGEFVAATRDDRIGFGARDLSATARPMAWPTKANLAPAFGSLMSAISWGFACAWTSPAREASPSQLRRNKPAIAKPQGSNASAPVAAAMAPASAPMSAPTCAAATGRHHHQSLQLRRVWGGLPRALNASMRCVISNAAMAWSTPWQEKSATTRYRPRDGCHACRVVSAPNVATATAMPVPPIWRHHDSSYRERQRSERQIHSAVGIDNTAIVGAPYEDYISTVEGAAYIYTRIGEWQQRAMLTHAGRGFNDRFGSSVDISGNTAIVGAPGDGTGGTAIFDRSGNSWRQIIELTSIDIANGDNFVSVAIDGNTAIVGSSGDDDDGSGSGSAYIFTRQDGVWRQTVKLTAPDGAASDGFGGSVAIDGQTVIVGATGDDDRGRQAARRTSTPSLWAPGSTRRN